MVLINLKERINNINWRNIKNKPIETFLIEKGKNHNIIGSC